MDEPTTWDQRKFDEALQAYQKVSSRTLQEIVNTKAYYIARKAIWFTAKADSFKIKQQLGGIVTVNRLSKSGKTVKHRQLQLVQAEQHAAPLAALIVNARLGREGSHGLYGRTMERAIRNLLSSRMRSIAFIKSGWLPAVKKLAPLADKKGQPATDTDARQRGRPKGDAHPAQSGWNPVAEIINLASARHDKNGALMRVGGKGLQTAFQDETASMWEYTERKMLPDAEQFNRAAA